MERLSGFFFLLFILFHMLDLVTVPTLGSLGLIAGFVLPAQIQLAIVGPVFLTVSSKTTSSYSMSRLNTGPSSGSFC